VPDRAWEPAGSSGLDIPYSPAAVAGGTVWVSGCISMDEAGEIVADDFVSQARRVYDGIPEALAAIHARGDRLAVVTSKIRNHAERIIADLPFGHLFERVYAPGPESAHSQKASLPWENLSQCKTVATPSRVANKATDTKPARTAAQRRSTSRTRRKK